MQPLGVIDQLAAGSRQGRIFNIGDIGNEGSDAGLLHAVICTGSHATRQQHVTIGDSGGHAGVAVPAGGIETPAHRGASMLAPENTDAAARLAASLGVSGLETDIHVSQDGGLFLLHDDTFARTTDVASVFPEREDAPASDFTLAEISQLNAGEWFVEQDPFHSIRDGLVAPELVSEYRQQPVPLLLSLAQSQPGRLHTLQSKPSTQTLKISATQCLRTAE